MYNKFFAPKIGFNFKKPENLFLAIALTFGTIFTLIIAPFHAESEPQHYYRAYQISEGKFVGDKKITDCYGQQFETYLPDTTCVGGMLPTSLLTTVKLTEGIESRINPRRKQNLATILDLLNLPLDPNNRVFLRFPNISSYFPITHLSQAVGMAIGRLFNASPLLLMYAGRICNLLVWVSLVYLAIKIIPFYKWVLILLALTSMSLFQAASLSGDAIANGAAFLFFAYILKSTFSGTNPIQKIEMFSIAFLSLLLSLCKLAYCPMLFLLWLIPKQRFGSAKKYFLLLSLIILGCVAVVLSWMFLTRHLSVPTRLDLPPITAAQRLDYLASQPWWKMWFLLGNTIRLQGLTYLEQLLGGIGWGEAKLPTWHIVSYALVLVGVAACSREKDMAVSLRKKAISFSIIAINATLIFSWLYISWTALDSDVIQGIQGRYFIPLSPLAFLLLYNQKIKLNLPKFELAIASYLLFCQTLTVALLLNRYWL